jgi:ATP-dependent exoDNAse (exonuclease V) alpha subunit
MVATRPLARLLEEVRRAGGKLVLVGDHRQLPELEAGGCFRALVRRGLAVELNENHRQHEAWERRALDQLRDGAADQAINAYNAHDRIHVADTDAATREQLAGDWHAASSSRGDAVMIAQRRSDVADLNQRARDLRRATGALGGPQLTLPGGEFAVGDRVVIKRNDARLGVTNGERGDVVSVDPAAQKVVVDFCGTAVTLDQAYLATPTRRGDPSLQHGYALTCRVAQGLTVDHAFVIADQTLNRELAYTALSRGRISNHLYLAREPENARAEYAPTDPNRREPLQRLTAALTTIRANILAIDTGHDDPAVRLAQARLDLDRARTERAELQRSRWRPGRRRALTASHTREAAAAENLAQLMRQADEQRHAQRPFVERTAQRRTAAQLDRIVEHRLERGKSRGLDR